jgi:hypothetical protein
MAHRGGTLNLGNQVLVKDLPHQAHPLPAFDYTVPDRGDPGAFLSPVLEGEKAVVYQGGRILSGVPAINAKDPALFMELVLPIPGQTNRRLQVLIHQYG